MSNLYKYKAEILVRIITVGAQCVSGNIIYANLSEWATGLVGTWVKGLLHATLEFQSYLNPNISIFHYLHVLPSQSLLIFLFCLFTVFLVVPLLDSC